MYIKKNLPTLASVKFSKKQGDVSKLTKAEIAAILYVEYAGNIYLTKNKKPELTKSLEENINGNPNYPATESSSKYPMIKKESGKGG